ncbi:MAG: hypothetical protein JJ975_09675 [Bacteroidia bacterium]|nr:hypothetical protein [Bacteroidia bacterium]
MRIATVLFFSALLMAFSQPDEPLDSFVKTQLETYEVIAPTTSFNVTYALERYQLHREKTSAALKSLNSHSNENSYNLTVYSRIYLWQFDFSSNERCSQAIDSLMNCFPIDCTPIEKYENTPMKTPPSIWVLNKNSIYIAQTACEQVDSNWVTFKHEFVERLATDQAPVIVTDCGRLSWTTKEGFTRN